MSLAIIAPGKDRSAWIRAINRLDPTIEAVVHPEISDPLAVDGAVLWKHPADTFQKYPNLKWVTSLGAGTDYILNDPHLPTHVLVTRIVDKNLSRDMKRSACMAVLNYEHHMANYYEQQKEALWRPLARRGVRIIGIMGMGEMGKAIASGLRELGYIIKGYSRTGKTVDGISVFGGNKVPGDFLRDLDVLICALPLTPQTRGILDHDLFGRAKKGMYLVALGRGDHLVEQDLLSALDNGYLSGAWLDVFKQEPLPEEHPFWQREEITVTPHVASITDPETASEVIVENYKRALMGRELLFPVDRERGY